jgi:hypothetical protein
MSDTGVVDPLDDCDIHGRKGEVLFFCFVPDISHGNISYFLLPKIELGKVSLLIIVY